MSTGPSITAIACTACGVVTVQQGQHWYGEPPAVGTNTAYGDCPACGALGVPTAGAWGAALHGAGLDALRAVDTVLQEGSAHDDAICAHLQDLEDITYAWDGEPVPDAARFQQGVGTMRAALGAVWRLLGVDDSAARPVDPHGDLRARMQTWPGERRAFGSISEALEALAAEGVHVVDPTDPAGGEGA